MKFGLKTFLVVIACIACFLGGWESHKYKFNSAKRPYYVINGLTVRVKENLAVINLGEHDGIEIGETVDFFRKFEWVGTGLVLKTEDDLAAVEFDEGHQIQEDDHIQVPKLLRRK